MTTVSRDNIHTLSWREIGRDMIEEEAALFLTFVGVMSGLKYGTGQVLSMPLLSGFSYRAILVIGGLLTAINLLKYVAVAAIKLYQEHGR